MRLLNEDYSNALETHIQENVDRYKRDDFGIEEDNFIEYPPIPEPYAGLLDEMDSENDYKSAVALYEAFPNLTHLEAADHSFWNTLSHTTLFPYVKKRWPYKPNTNGAPTYEKHVQNHWFYESGLRKNALAHLWWCVKVSVQPEKGELEKYELTKVLFANYSFRVVFWGASNFFRNEAATKGVLRWIKDNYESFMDAGDRKGKFICVHLHKLGAMKQLCCLDSNFFYEELDRIKEQIQNAPKRPDKYKTNEEKMEKEDA